MVVEVLAADSMGGRLAGTRGAAMAVDYVALQLERLGLEPVFPTGFLQPVPLARVVDGEGVEQLILEQEVLPGMMLVEHLADVNVGALLRGRVADAEGEVVVLSSHFDHRWGSASAPVEAVAELGSGGEVRAAGELRAAGGGGGPGGDGGNAVSGVAALLEVARALSGEGPGDRTILFLVTTGGSQGELGTRLYLRDPPLPMERTVAAIHVEGVGHPDPLAGGSGHAWLAGFERTTLGELLVVRGLPVVPDPRPEKGLYFQGHHIFFVKEGVPAHTLSSRIESPDQAPAADPGSPLDYQHLARVTETLVVLVRTLANGDAIRWRERGRP
jgi:hypothetical protein